MQINTKTGLIENVPFTASPNFDDRPASDDIDLLVIHSISLPPGEYGGPWIEKLFSNTLPADEHPYFKEIHQMKVSAHVLIRRDGTVQQFVPFHQRAWHAGASCYEKRETCNDYSIGIELEGTDDSEFEDIQYQQLAELINALDNSYDKINKNRLTGHSDIAAGRKSDPGSGFDWGRLRGLLT